MACFGSIDMHATSTILQTTRGFTVKYDGPLRKCTLAICTRKNAMILRQFLHTDPVAASYMLGYGDKSACTVVDPVGDIAPYLAAAEATGMRILYVIDTHLPADHLSVGRALAEVAGAQYVLHADAAAIYGIKGVQEGNVLAIGNVAIRVMHTPGHTPEYICLVVTDRTRSADPWFIRTGLTLMVCDLARTELTTSAEEGARALFQSVQALKALPDWLEVNTGGLFGVGLRPPPERQATSTIGYEKRYNRAFRIEDEADFVLTMVANIPAPPHGAAQNRAVNTGQSVTAR